MLLVLPFDTMPLNNTNLAYITIAKTDAEARESWDRTVKTPVHDIEREIAYMRRLLYRDYRITVDSRLREIFYGSVNFVMSRITAISSFYP